MWGWLVYLKLKIIFKDSFFVCFSQANNDWSSFGNSDNVYSLVGKKLNPDHKKKYGEFNTIPF